jgi:hypothetical protein
MLETAESNILAALEASMSREAAEPGFASELSPVTRAENPDFCGFRG